MANPVFMNTKLEDRVVPLNQAGFIDMSHPSDIFVFGSNALGHHLGGAARAAYEQYDARWGRHNTKTGRCYAIDTLGTKFEQLPEDVLLENFKKLKHTADGMQYRYARFLLTEVGCGIAGYTPKQIADLIIKSQLVFCPNVYYHPTLLGYLTPNFRKQVVEKKKPWFQLPFKF